jgi:Zn-finger nucleic acid-binding protein
MGGRVDCPVCRQPLIVAEREGIELDVCQWCHGLWFDAGELTLLAEKLGRTLAVPDSNALAAVATDEKPRRCPRCGKAMEKVELGATPRVVLDHCPGHGLWFDHGELGSLVSQLAVTPGSHHEAVTTFMGETIGASGATLPSNDAGNPAGEVKR